MRRRLLALLIALTALFGTVAIAQPAAADPVGTTGRVLCDIGLGGILGAATDPLCKAAGSVVSDALKAEFASIWNSEVGDLIKSGEDFAKTCIRFTLTLALQGPSLKLEDTGLFGANATLDGMLVWLGLVIGAAGFMWQIGKMAITGQARHLGKACAGWAQNMMLSVFGLTAVGLLLTAGDQLTKGLTDSVFGNDSAAYDRILKVLVPEAIANPVIVACGVLVLLIVGFIQMVLIFLRQSAIPIQCLLLPIAGAGRMGGETTQKWAPKLITSILVIIVYKPILAVIICVGFSEVGNASSTTEWLRGVATLVLGVLAPGPLTKIFAPIGAEVGSGMAAGGAMGAMGALGGMAAARMGGDGSSDGGAPPTGAVDHAKHVEQTMPKSYQGDKNDQQQEGSDALTQASRNQPPGPSPTPVPGQMTSPENTTGVSLQKAGVSSGTAATGAVPAVGMAIQVFDGVNNAVQQGAGQMGSGGGGS
ncbi:hypothetical protein [Streptacidiphilus carbonis]|uniref:hypothetical protein n=1 Tax=Streptacidiphilus carbonis TaxID=105422 RepID=UPI0006942B1C|nr:hypothetical protein [Streptacidiphilus carbonis]